MAYGHVPNRSGGTAQMEQEPITTVAEPLLVVEDLHVWFDLAGGGELHAVQGVSFELDVGERLGLVGESGSGKTTTILALMGLLPANASIAGSVRLTDAELLKGGEDSVRSHRWCDLAMVFQGAMNAFNPVQTVGAQIVEPMELHDTHRGKAARARARELMELVGIPGARADHYPHEFSGGMRQRAAIAMALACEPKVLLADEPTTALDVMIQAQILELLLQLTDELGLALIIVTHDLPVVGQVCERAAVMYAGEIVEHGATTDLYDEPRHPYTRLLFAATPSLHGDDQVMSIPGAPPRLDHPIDGCPFAPRCDRTFDRCLSEQPPLHNVSAGHTAACHLNRRAESGRPT
jgi:peptide/nickel transport system ATP-binding protein